MKLETKNDKFDMTTNDVFLNANMVVDKIISRVAPDVWGKAPNDTREWYKEIKLELALLLMQYHRDGAKGT